jgi:glutamate synthase (NADPH) small chain
MTSQSDRNRRMMTSPDGVFAAGDVVRGASLVVWAIRASRDVAEYMRGFLKAKAKQERLAA